MPAYCTRSGGCESAVALIRRGRYLAVPDRGSDDKMGIRDVCRNTDQPAFLTSLCTLAGHFMNAGLRSPCFMSFDTADRLLAVVHQVTTTTMVTGGDCQPHG